MQERCVFMRFLPLNLEDKDDDDSVHVWLLITVLLQFAELVNALKLIPEQMLFVNDETKEYLQLHMQCFLKKKLNP
jgi:hypothetical protein